MKKFCCEHFKSRYEDGGIIKDHEGNPIKEIFPNIKIIKIKSDNYNKGRNLYRYLFVCGLLKDKPPIINMAYCPFCGTHLFKFYTKDEYINGNEKDFFNY